MTPQRSIDSAEALCRKLERTFYRRSDYRENQVDWVFDVAVTAWHLVDWVAKERNAELKATQKQLKKKCPELAVCEQVCNGAKHLVLDNPHLKHFDVATGVRGTDGLVGISRTDLIPGDGKSHTIVLTPQVGITDKDGTRWEAVVLFRKVLFIWQDELGLPRS
jgi:hypothetical protein